MLCDNSDSPETSRLHDKVCKSVGEEGGQLHLHGAEPRVRRQAGEKRAGGPRHHQVGLHEKKTSVNVVGPHVAQTGHNTPPSRLI